jgi:zeaxanthin glucosyltransferase
MPPSFGLMRKAVFYQRTAGSSSTKEPQEAPRESQCVQRIFTPERKCIVNQTPQLEVLKRASVCITHAGLNTVLESLAQGVPQLGIPITFDQPGVATRIAAKKTGVTMPFEKLTSDQLSTLLGEVLNNALYRENARKFQDVIAKTNGLSMAADLVEQSLGVTKKAGAFQV